MTRSNEDTDSHFSVQMINGFCDNFAAVFIVQLLTESQPFKDEIFLFYVKIHCLPRSKYCPPRLNKTNPLILYEAIVAVRSQTHAQHINVM
jgi:hypothetical protein